MKVIRGIGKNRCERKIDFSRSLKFYFNVGSEQANGFGIPVIEKDYHCNEVYFWDSEDIRATIGKDKYELRTDNPKVFAQLKNNVELLFALHNLK